MTFKSFKLAVLGLVASLAMAACGGASKNTDALSSIKEKGKIVVAMNPEFAPFEFKTLIDGKDTIVGSDVELAKAIGEKLGGEVEFSSMSFDNVLAAVQSGKADLAISGISATEERAKVFDFSESYYTALNKVIVQKSDLDKYQSTADFSGAKVAAQKGSIQENVVKEQLEGTSLISLVKNGDMINELKAGKVQAVVLEEPIAKGYVAKNPDLAIAEVELSSASDDAYAVAMAKGSDSLKAEVDAVIQELKASGQIEKDIQEAYDLSVAE